MKTRWLLWLLPTAWHSAAALAQVATVTAPVNLRSAQSTTSPVVAGLSAGSTVSLIDATPRLGYYHVRAPGKGDGWVYAPYLRLPLAAGGTPAPPNASHVSNAAPGAHGSNAVAGCGDSLWKHVYDPARLLVKQPCVTVTGVIVDASNGANRDGARHEADGDTHSWIRLDPAFRDMLDAGNMSNEGGNLVFEIVCHYSVSQPDAKPACSGFADHTVIPPVGTHVEITGTYVQDTNYAHWNEIHPVSRIAAVP